MELLTGAELGAAIEHARKLKGVSKVEMARHFGVAPPSIQDWVNRGTIAKERLPGLWAYFADVVGHEHWGLPVEADPLLRVIGLPGRAVTIEQAAEVMGRAIAAAPKDQREAIATNLAGWARDGGAEHWRAALVTLLSRSIGKRKRAA